MVYVLPPAKKSRPLEEPGEINSNKGECQEAGLVLSEVQGVIQLVPDRFIVLLLELSGCLIDPFDADQV